MKKTKKRWQGISLSGVILVCTFLAACGGEAQETVTETVDEAEGETTAVTGDLSIANDFGYETAREAAFLKTHWKPQVSFQMEGIVTWGIRKILMKIRKRRIRINRRSMMLTKMGKKS